MADTYHSSNSSKFKQEDCGPGQTGQKARPHLKTDHTKQAGAWLEKHLPSKHEALSSNPITEREREREREREEKAEKKKKKVNAAKIVIKQKRET
jgi:hypothetical protein